MSIGGRPPGFSCDVDERADTVIARMQGELDLFTSTEAEQIVADVVARNPGKRLVFDLRELTFMDSTGLRLLLRWDSEARGDGFHVSVVRGPEQVERLFELTGLQNHFDFVEDAE